jgi:hypothetical protein
MELYVGEEAFGDWRCHEQLDSEVTGDVVRETVVDPDEASLTSTCTSTVQVRARAMFEE